MNDKQLAMALSNLNPGDLSDRDEWDNLQDKYRRDTLFLRESRIRGRRFHQFWFSEYQQSNREWVRDTKTYKQYVFYGQWREFKGQMFKLGEAVWELVLAIFGGK